MKLSDESGLMENDVKAILVRLQKHSKDKSQKNFKFKTHGIANFKIKIVGNQNHKFPVNTKYLGCSLSSKNSF